MLSDYENRKFPKYSDTQRIRCTHSKIWTMWLYHRVMSPNDADGMANSVDPDQTASLGAVWSGSALFAQAYLSLRYAQFWLVKTSDLKMYCIPFLGCYFWSSVSIFTTPVDSILLNIENMNLHMPSLQFGGNFEFNVIRKYPNISEWNCKCKSCQMRWCHVSKFSLFKK